MASAQNFILWQQVTIEITLFTTIRKYNQLFTRIRSVTIGHALSQAIITCFCHCCNRKARAACAQSFTLAASNRDHLTRSLYYCLFTPHIYGVFLHAHSVRGEPRISALRQRSGCNNIPSFLQRTAPIARSFCEGCTWHNFTSWLQHHFVAIGKPEWHVLKALHWQQATIEITQ